MSIRFDERDRDSVLRDVDSSDEEVRRLAVERIEADGMDGLRKVSGDTFDLALIDINMPIMDGLKLISLMRGEDAMKDIPIVVITTEGAQEDRDRALQLGADEYLTKPIQTNRVLAVAKSLLEA